MARTAEAPARHESNDVFDLESSPIPSFAALVAHRQNLFSSRTRLDSFRRLVENLGVSGETGRRKGLGLWMIGDYGHAAQILEKHANDDVAAFTHANALMSLRRFREARPIYERLSKAYPEEPRPRGGWIEAELESDLAGDEEQKALENLQANLKKAPHSFASSAEGNHMLAREAELRRDWEKALEHYAAARQLDGTMRTNLFRFAYLAERCGLDDVALDCYETLTRLHPIDRNVLINLGVLYEDLGRDEDAAACYDTIVISRPSDTRARLYLQDARSGIDMYYDEDLERKEDRLNQILRIPITDFELSVRARNCLNKMNILSLGDLVKKTEAELLSYKNFGETSLNEIKEILGSKGLRLGMAREEAVASIESGRRRYSGEEGDVMNKPIAELELSIRARRTVEAIGCMTLGDIAQHTEDELLGMPNFGVTSLQELKSKLAEFGLKLKPKGG